MHKSKRFISVSTGVIIFCIGVFFFKIEPVSMAESITMLLSPYLVAESVKPSKKI